MYTLWDEYINGIGGRKPARQFTREERGAKGVKQSFYFRKPFWMCMQKLVDKGATESVAFSRIQQVYGGFGSITNMLQKLVKDERNGGHRFLEPDQL